MWSITIDAFGYMAVGCNDFLISLYNAYYGTYLNLQFQLAPSNVPYFTAVDVSGRFVSMSSSAIDIYY